MAPGYSSRRRSERPHAPYLPRAKVEFSEPEGTVLGR